MCDEKKKIAFLCIGNSCRSQMAEGYLRHIAGDKYEVYSAGTSPASWGVSENAIVVMAEEGIDISDHTSKHLNDIPLEEMDIIVTMGCGVECPYYPGKKMVEWEIEDPVGRGLDTFQEARDTIEEKIDELIEDLSTE